MYLSERCFQLSTEPEAKSWGQTLIRIQAVAVRKDPALSSELISVRPGENKGNTISYEVYFSVDRPKNQWEILW